MSLSRALPRLAATAILTLLACGSLDTFTIRESATTTVQGSSVLGTALGVVGFDGFIGLDLSSNETLQNQGVERSDIDSVFVRQLTLTITDPSGEDFQWLDSIAFYAEAEGLDRVRIASGGPFEAGLSTIGLNVENVNLADYVAAPAIDITTEATGRPPAQDTTVEAEIELDVDVNVSGALCGE